MLVAVPAATAQETGAPETVAGIVEPALLWVDERHAREADGADRLMLLKSERASIVVDDHGDPYMRFTDRWSDPEKEAILEALEEAAIEARFCEADCRSLRRSEEKHVWIVGFTGPDIDYDGTATVMVQMQGSTRELSYTDTWDLRLSKDDAHWIVAEIDYVSSRDAVACPSEQRCR